MPECMGFFRPEWGGTGTTGNLKRKFRWLFLIENITTGNTEALPCWKASRPKFQFKEMQAEHLNETISFPSKTEWQSIQISLYDRCINTQNPIFTWLKMTQYDPSPIGCGAWYPAIDPLSLKTCAGLQLLDGCGNIIEAWTLEHAYPQSVDWGELESTNYDIVTVDVTLKYDRAYQTFPFADHALYTTTACNVCLEPQCPQPIPGQGTNTGPSSVQFAPFQPLELDSSTIGIPQPLKLKEPDFIML